MECPGLLGIKCSLASAASVAQVKLISNKRKHPPQTQGRASFTFVHGESSRNV